MGRLSKKKRDRIRAMIQSGFTTREIVSEVGSSASTISRVRKELKNNIQQGKESTVEYALLKSLYQMHRARASNFTAESMRSLTSLKAGYRLGPWIS